MQVESFLEDSARRDPSKVALICQDRRLTYSDFDEQANRLGHSLRRNGLKRNDRAIVWLDNTPEAAISIFAILKASGVFVVVHPTTKKDKLQYLMADCGATVLITDSAKARSLGAVGHEETSLRGIWLVDDGEAPDFQCGSLFRFSAILESRELPSSTPGKLSIDIDLAALIYTSGSSGKSKGVMVTHQNIVAAATSITTYLENVSSDIVLSVLPLSFDYGLYQLLMAFKVGATLVLERSFSFPHAVLQRAVLEKATGLPIVPTMSAILMQTDLTQYDLSTLRYITNTAAALPAQHTRKLRSQLPHVRIYSMYGLTECKRVSYLPPEEIDRRPTSVGRGMPNEEVYLVDDSGERLPHGSTGELVVRGANVMKGYWADPEETAKRLRPGPYPWEQVLYTGDLFRSDGEGFLYFVGRKDDIIKSRGEKVSPREVEDVLYGVEAIAEAAVVPVPDAVLGEAIKAIVVLKQGCQCTEKEILRHCSKHLEDFMVPKFVEFRTSLPKTSTGKISKRELVEAS